MSRHSRSTGRLGLQLLRGALNSLLPGFGGDHLGLQTAGPEWECQWGESRRCCDQNAPTGQPIEGAGDPDKLQLRLQDFQSRLTQQQVFGIVAVENVKHEAAGGL